MANTYSMFFPWPTNDVDSKLLRSMGEQCRAAAQANGHTTIGGAMFVGVKRLENSPYPFEYEFSIRLRDEIVEVA